MVGIPACLNGLSTASGGEGLCRLFIFFFHSVCTSKRVASLKPSVRSASCWSREKKGLARVPFVASKSLERFLLTFCSSASLSCCCSWFLPPSYQVQTYLLSFLQPPKRYDGSHPLQHRNQSYDNNAQVVLLKAIMQWLCALSSGVQSGHHLLVALA